MTKSRHVPDKSHAIVQEWSDKKVLRYSSYITRAVNHAMGRNARVIHVLCYVSHLTSTGYIERSSDVKVKAAVWQNYKSQCGNQAAHYLPGQLLINNRNLSDLVSSGYVCTAIKCLFGDVHDLPANYNKADSQAESKGSEDGLCDAFQKAVEFAIANTRDNQIIDRDAIRQAYRTEWKPRARIAYQNALNRKAEKYTKPELEFGQAGGVEYNAIKNLAARENASNYQQAIENQQNILRHYLADIERDSAALINNRISELAQTLTA